MKKFTTKPITIVSITTLAVVFVVAIGLVLANNYRQNQALPKGVPITHTVVEPSVRLTNSDTIDHPYLIDSAAALTQQLKLNQLADFDPETQVLVGVVLSAQPNAGYGVAVDSTTTHNNQMLINYRVTLPEEDRSYASVITYPSAFITLNRTDLPNFSLVNFVFTNLTNGATQTIPKAIGV